MSQSTTKSSAVAVIADRTTNEQTYFSNRPSRAI